MLTVVLNSGAVLAAAKQVGIFGEEALVRYLGMRLEPVTAVLIATIVLALPLTIAAAVTIETHAVSTLDTGIFQLQ